MQYKEKLRDFIADGKNYTNTARIALNFQGSAAQGMRAEISSPNFPLQYPMNADTQWVISVSHYYARVTLYINDFDLEENYDHLTIYDGPYVSGSILGKLTGRYEQLQQKIFISSFNSMFLRLSSDYSSSARGFKASVFAVNFDNSTNIPTRPPPTNSTRPPPTNSTRPPSTNSTDTPTPDEVCPNSNKVFYVRPNETFMLASPNYPNGYYNNLNCLWEIESSNSSYVVQVITDDVSLESCCDRVNVHDGRSINDPKLGSFSNEMNQTFYSTGKSLLLNFMTDFSVTDKGFQVRYTVVLEDSVPNPVSTTPVYNYTIPVVVTRPETPVITTSIPENITNSCPDKNNTLLASPNQVLFLESPNYPNNYYNYLNCSWLILSSNSTYVAEITTDDVYLESCCDYVYVYDGNSTNDRYLGSFSNGAYKKFTSTAGSLLLNFVTDYSVTYKGFRVRYTVVQKNLVPHPDATPQYTNTMPPINSTVIPPRPVNTTSPSVNATDLCPGVDDVFYAYPDQIYFIETPNYPNNYYNNLYCSWIVESTDPLYEVQVTSIDVVLEGCCDTATVHDGRSTSNRVIGSLASNINQTFQSTAGVLLIDFRSDSSITFKGFKLQYMAVLQNFTQKPNSNSTVIPTRPETPIYTTIADPSINETAPPPGDVCPALNVLRASPFQVFNLQSPNYPNNYYNNLDCFWLIQTFAAGHVIQIKTIDVNLETGFDSVIIYDGGSKNSTVLGSLKNGFNETFHSTYDLILINFVTDQIVTRKGFELLYTAVQRNTSQVPARNDKTKERSLNSNF